MFVNAIIANAVTRLPGDIRRTFPRAEPRAAPRATSKEDEGEGEIEHKND